MRRSAPASKIILCLDRRPEGATLAASSGALHPPERGRYSWRISCCFIRFLGCDMSSGRLQHSWGLPLTRFASLIFAGEQTDDLNEAAASILLGRVLAFLRSV